MPKDMAMLERYFDMASHERDITPAADDDAERQIRHELFYYA